MGDEAALLAAIAADRAGEAARLVYADWLDEAGRVGGAFLRLECALNAAARRLERR